MTLIRVQILWVHLTQSQKTISMRTKINSITHNFILLQWVNHYQIRIQMKWIILISPHIKTTNWVKDYSFVKVEWTSIKN
jgi:hypothetical protein